MVPAEISPHSQRLRLMSCLTRTWIGVTARNTRVVSVSLNSVLGLLVGKHFAQGDAGLIHTLVDVGLRASQFSGGGYNLAVFSDSAKNAIEWNSESRPAFSCLFYNSRASHKIS